MQSRIVASSSKVRSRLTHNSSTSPTSSSRDSQILQLPDGGTLGFAEYGASKGFPVLYFHGYPTSRLDGFAVDHEASIRNIRLICPDRPGYGLSTFQPSRKITDWPRTVDSLVQHLALERYTIIGGSGGGPYALACGLHPARQLVRIGIFAGAPPWYLLDRRDMAWLRLLYLAVWYTPSTLSFLLAWLIPAMKWLCNGLLASRIDAFLKTEPRAAGQPPHRRDEFVRAVFEGFRQGPQAAVQEGRLLTADWGFKFEHIKHDVLLWHGVNDINSPIQYIREMAKCMPHAQLREFDDNHYSIAYRFGEYLSAIVDQ